MACPRCERLVGHLLWRWLNTREEERRSLLGPMDRVGRTLSSHLVQSPERRTHQRHNTPGKCFRLYTGMGGREHVLWGSLKTSPYNVEKVLSVSPLEEQSVMLSSLSLNGLLGHRRPYRSYSCCRKNGTMFCLRELISLRGPRRHQELETTDPTRLLALC